MAVQFSNNAATNLSAAISASATSITVADASEFPTLSGSDYTYVTLSNLLETTVEVVKVTAISGNTLTVVRGQDNTTASAFASGDKCELRVTAALLNDVAEQADTNTEYTAGSGITLTGTTFSNSAPDQTVSLTGAGATTISGTYPNFTISSTDTNTNTTYTAGTNLSLSGTTFNLNTNLSGLGTISSGAITSSGRGTFDELTLTGSTDNLTFNEASGDWTINNAQQNNGITIFDGTAGVSVNYNGAAVAQFDGSGGMNLITGSLRVGGTAVIDSSRNLTNIGTISSGSITTSGDISIPVAQALYFGGGSHTYISEDTDNRLRFFTGGSEFMRFTQSVPQLDIFQPIHTNSSVTIDVDNEAEGALRIEANQTNPNADFYFAQKIVSTLSGTTATTADREQGGIYMDLNSTATGGDTSNEHRVYGAYLDVDSTGDADLVYGVYADATATPTTGQTSSVYGGYFKAEDNGGAGEVQTIIGVQGAASSDNATSDTNNMYGGYFLSSSTSDSGAIGNTHGVYSEIQIDTAADVMGTSYVYRAEYDNNSGIAQTNSTYLYYGNYAGTLPTTAYGVYILDAVRNYFGGTLTAGLGSTTAASYGFNDDLNTGMYSPANHQLGFLVNGSRKLLLDSTGVDIQNGTLEVGGTTVIDSSRNLTNIGTITATGDINLNGGNLTRNAHNTGHLEGSYNSVGSSNNVASNPIYTIGSSYNPASTSLSLMYGIGFTKGSASFITGDLDAGANNGWGLYVAADGDARVWLNGSDGIISSTGQHYADGSLVWNAGNDGSGSGLDADLLDGTTWGTMNKVVGGTNFDVDAANFNGLRFWNGSANYRISMSASGASGAGRVSGETTSDYNMYFKMDGGTNRGFVFQSGTSNRAGIDAAGNIRTVANVDCNYLRADRIYSNNDGSSGYFYNDTSTRTAYAGGDFYIQNSVGNYYNYATNQYLGDSSGDNIYVRGNTISGDAWSLTGSGAFSTHGVIDVNGGHGGLNITNSSILSSAASTWTGDPGGSGKIQYHSNRWYIVGDSSSNRLVQFRRNGTDKSHIDNNGTLVGGGMWSSYNDGSGSGLDADTVDGVQASIIMNKGTDIPGSANLNSYTTIGFYHQNSNASAGSGSNYPVSRAGMLTVTADGAMVYQTYHQYNGNAYYHRSYYNGTWYAWRKVWTDGNDGSGSGLDADLLDGYNSAENGGSTIHRLASNGYSQLQNWTNVASSGLYSTTLNSAHFSPNNGTSYATWKTTGSRGGYDGIMFDSGGDVAIMYDSSGNGGMYREANGRWHIYHRVADNCLGVCGSTTSSSYGIYEQGGGIYSTGNITAYSDRRIKQNIVTLDSALDKVNALRGVYYNKIDDPEKTKQIGFIAQEVNEVVPELVTYAEDVDQYGVNYGNATALLVEAVKDLTQQVKDLKAEIEEMKNA